LVKLIERAWFKRALILLASTLTVPLVEYGDYLTGPEARFDLFYFIPVVLTSWYLGRRYGLVLAFLCAAASGAAEYFSGGEVVYWNAFVHLLVLSILAIVLSALRGVLDRERGAARTDELTGGANRRQFFEIAVVEIIRSRRYGHPLSLAILDLDNFKIVNDQRGHSEGDEVLRTVSRTLRSGLRATDTVARLGGDEFALLLPETGPEASEVLEKIRVRLLDAFRDGGWPVTTSIGAVTYRCPPEDIDAVIRGADALLYRAKGAGRDALVHQSFD
jgi:diguanylate cyclase (GGDEF)-like protein